MGVVVQKSLAISNRDATPKVLSFGNLLFADLKECIGSVPVASTDSVGSTYFFGTIPSNARMSAVSAAFAALTGATMDIGLFQTEAAGGAAVSSQFFAAALPLTTATPGEEIANSNVQTLANAEQMLWQALGLATDPATFYDVVGTLQHVSSTSGQIVLKLRFAQ
jgi:hypothetical protein